MPPFAHKQPPKIQPATIGNAGVYYVCFELSLRGLIAMPTVRNTAGIDVLVSTASGDHLADLQVKSSQSRVKFWPTPSGEKISTSPNVWFVFLRWLKHEGRFEGFMDTAANVRAEVLAGADRQVLRGARDFPAWVLSKDLDVQARLAENWRAWSPSGFDTAPRLI